MNNGWQSLIQQGMGMLGGSSMGYGLNSFSGMGSFGGLSGFSSGGIFTNCFGEVNYDAMAGFGVANAVLGVVSQAITSNQSEKAPKVDYEAKIKELDKKIDDLKSKDASKEIDSKYDADIKSAKTTVDSLTKSKGIKEDTLKKLEAKENKTATDEENITKLKNEIDTLNGSADTKGSIKEAEAKVEDAKKAKEEAIKEKKADIDKQIEELEKEKDEYQSKLDAQQLDKADGAKLTRTSDKKYNTYLKPDGTIDETKSYTKKDLRTAINQFMNAVGDEKLIKAKNVLTMYKQINTNNSSDITSTLKQAAVIAQKYVKENDKKTAE